MARFDLNLLQSLDALLRNRNVTAAAEEIGVTQPAMSGMLSRLREQLNDTLLARVGQSYELTPRALELKDQVRQALLMITGLVRPTEDPDLTLTQRHIRLMASEYSQLMILPHVFARAMSEAPHVTFEVVPIFDPISHVYLGDVDLCITAASIANAPPQTSALLRTQTILEEQFVALVDDDHPLRGSVTLAELRSYPRVETHFRGLDESVETMLLEKRGDAGIPAISMPSFITVPPLLIGTKRVCIFPKRLLERYANLAVRALDLPESYAVSTLRSLWHARNDMDPVHRWLRITVQEAGALIRH